METTEELTYPAPEHGWTCFHCGETFLKAESARIHFGTTPDRTPGCRIKAGEERGLLMALRKAEETVDAVSSYQYKPDHQVELAEAVEVLAKLDRDPKSCSALHTLINYRLKGIQTAFDTVRTSYFIIKGK